MKKLILVTLVLASQVSMATSPDEVNACFGKVKQLSDRLIEVGTPMSEENGWHVGAPKSELLGRMANGAACKVTVAQLSFNGDDVYKAHSEVYIAIENGQTGSTNGFSMPTYHDTVISVAGSGVPLPDKKMDFHVGKCEVNEDILSASLSFTQLYKTEKLSIKNKGNGILEFKVKEDGGGFFGLGSLLTIGLEDNCIVDLNNQ